MTMTTMKRSDFRALLRQAQREQEAHDGGYPTYADMERAHRAARVAKLRERRLARMAELRAGRVPDSSL